MLRLLLASEDGYLYVYSLDVTEGGDCALIRQFHLSNKDEPTNSAGDFLKLNYRRKVFFPHPFICQRLMKKLGMEKLKRPSIQLLKLI